MAILVEIDAVTGEMVEREWAPMPPEPDAATILYPVDLWSRLTNEEAEQVEAAMATQPIRVQNIFRAASSYRSDHELWPLLTALATQLFGASRTSELLAPSVTL